MCKNYGLHLPFFNTYTDKECKQAAKFFSVFGDYLLKLFSDTALSSQRRSLDLAALVYGLGCKEV